MPRCSAGWTRCCAPEPPHWWPRGPWPALAWEPACRRGRRVGRVGHRWAWCPCCQPWRASAGGSSRCRDRDDRREPARRGGRCRRAVRPARTGAWRVRWGPEAVGWGTPRLPPKRPGLCGGAGPGTRPAPAARLPARSAPPAAVAASPRPGRGPPGWQGPAARCALEWRDTSWRHRRARWASRQAARTRGIRDVRRPSRPHPLRTSRGDAACHAGPRGHGWRRKGGATCLCIRTRPISLPTVFLGN